MYGFSKANSLTMTAEHTTESPSHISLPMFRTGTSRGCFETEQVAKGIIGWHYCLLHIRTLCRHVLAQRFIIVQVQRLYRTMEFRRQMALNGFEYRKPLD